MRRKGECWVGTWYEGESEVRCEHWVGRGRVEVVLAEESFVPYLRSAPHHCH